MEEDQGTREDCIFCKIAKGEIPSAWLAESKNTIAFLDITPANKGHFLVIPKQHVERIDQLPPMIFAEMSDVASKIILKLVAEIHPDGYNVLVNNGTAAGQEIMHLHLHVIPRYDSDDFKFRWTHKSYAKDEILGYAKKLL
ncbi:MAG: HIT family protein [Nanoarchaeota archaeon]